MQNRVCVRVGQVAQMATFLWFLYIDLIIHVKSRELALQCSSYNYYANRMMCYNYSDWSLYSN